MNVTLSKNDRERLLAKGLVHERATELMEHGSWERSVDVFYCLTDEGLEAVKKMVEPKVARKIESHQKIMKDQGGKVAKLENIPTLVKALLEPMERKWLYETNETEAAWLVNKTKYEPSQGIDDPAYVLIELVAYRHGTTTHNSMTFSIMDIKGHTIHSLLMERGFAVETPELREDYLRTDALLQELSPLVGVQMLAEGTYGQNNMTVDGQPTKVVLDDGSEEFQPSSHRRTRGIGGMWGDDVDVPRHSVLGVFDLRRHSWATVHVDQLKEYPWRTDRVCWG